MGLIVATSYNKTSYYEDQKTAPPPLLSDIHRPPPRMERKVTTIKQGSSKNPLRVPRIPVSSKKHHHSVIQDGKRIVPFFELGFMLRGRFRINEMIGSGGFGQIFRTVDRTTGRSFALKACEAVDDGKRLIIEQKVMVKLNGNRHTPFVVASGSLDLPTYKHSIHYIMMELLGQSLTSLRKTNNPWRRFSVGTALRVGEQCLDAIEAVHQSGYLHRDVKPSNMCIGLSQWGKHRTIYLIDFGMARKFIQPDGGLRSERHRAAFRGTTRYVSLNIHERKETGPVDDLWALYYSIIELGEGSLPWRLIFKQKEVETAKRKARFTDMCKRFPGQLYQFEQYLRTLSWSDTPDYRFLKTILQECWPTGLTSETPFEWELQKPQRRPSPHRG